MGNTQGMDAKLLGIHLNDHLAGARAGLELARRMLGANRGTPLEEDLASIVAQVEEDKAELERIMEHAAIARSRAKEALGLAAERVGRLKPNGRLVGYSPLSRLVELEGLVTGVSGKRSLWRTLRIAWSQDKATPPGVDLDHLEKRADEQLATLERLREAIVLAAFHDEPLTGAG